MKLRFRLRRHAPILALACCLCAQVTAQPRQPQPGDELIAALAASRSQGCGGRPGVGPALRANRELDETAHGIARGASPREAALKAGYRATRLFLATLSGYPSPAAVAQAITEKHCNALSDPALTEIGSHRQGKSYWVVLAAPFAPPPPSAAASVAARVLALTNEARAKPRECGEKSFGSAPPLQANALLGQAAALHAQDMAQHDYLEHEGRDGSSAADRVTRAGYRWRAVAENIASGQTTPEQVVQEWVRSPVHCANLMNASFSEMGVAYAVNRNSAGGIYWAQEFGRPR